MYVEERSNGMGLDQVTIDWWRGCEAGVFDTWNQLMTYIAVSYMCLVGAWTPADAGDPVWGVWVPRTDTTPAGV